MVLLAARAIDFAIFGTLGGLWIGGAVFIVVLYRWILRRERAELPGDGARPRTAARIEPTRGRDAVVGGEPVGHIA